MRISDWSSDVCSSDLAIVAVLFSILFAPTHYDLDAGVAIAASVALGLLIGLSNGVLVTVLRVPAFIATLTMLFVGRGFVLGLTGGKNIAYEVKLRELAVFALGVTNAPGSNNQIIIFLI